jgi:membrane protease YdiL (CAAX protease family)
MDAAVVVGGILLEATAWWVVAFRRGDVWRVTVPALTVLGIVALLTRPPWSPEVEPFVAALVGLATGVLLYLATRVFVVVIRPWRTFRRHAISMYERQGDRSLGSALLLSIALSAPGEELFWRGLVQPGFASALGGRAGLAAVLGWAAFVAANLPSANLAIVAGAVVGGATWTGLGWWCGGALAPMLSHAVWTSLMLSFPVVRSEEVPG